MGYRWVLRYCKLFPILREIWCYHDEERAEHAERIKLESIDIRLVHGSRKGGFLKTTRVFNEVHFSHAQRMNICVAVTKENAMREWIMQISNITHAEKYPAGYMKWKRE